jgi:hypothetical protein
MMTTDCTLFCPIQYYGEVNGVFYYYGYCAGTSTYLNSSDLTFYDPLCNPDPSVPCFSCYEVGSTPSAPPPILERASAVPCDGLRFQPSVECLVKGIANYIRPTDDFHPGPLAKQKNAINVKYFDKDKNPPNGDYRYARLFEIQHDKVGELLLIGQELENPVNTEYELKGKHGHHHIINPKNMKGKCYRTLTKG